jgi:hypothetical protein
MKGRRLGEPPIFSGGGAATLFSSQGLRAATRFQRGRRSGGGTPVTVFAVNRMTAADQDASGLRFAVPRGTFALDVAEFVGFRPTEFS